MGDTYYSYLKKCSINGLLNSLASICHMLDEVHAKGFIHNDLKGNNITYNGSVEDPVIHIIDFGMACRIGQPLKLFRNRGWIHSIISVFSYLKGGFWMAPETMRGDPMFPSGDVYSFGCLVDRLLARNTYPSAVMTPLKNIACECMRLDPSVRPALTHVAQMILSIKQEWCAPEMLND